MMRYEIGSEWDIQKIDLNTDNYYFFRSCRDSLYAIANLCKIKKVLLPAYSCDSMVTPFRNTGCEIDYYGIDINWQVDCFELKEKIKYCDAILIIDYFGRKTFSRTLISELKSINPKLIIIDDKTQNLFDFNRENDDIDFTVASLRKWIAIPDGAVLFSKNKFLITFNTESGFYSDKLNAMQLKNSYLRNESIDKKNYLELFNKANKFLDNSIGIFEISDYSRNKLLYTDYIAMKKARLCNFRILNTYIQNDNVVKLTDNELSLYYPVLVSNRDEIQKKLAHSNIYCPIIWEISNELEKKYPILGSISERILAIPCDHRYNSEDMKYICNTLKSILDKG